MPCVSRRVLLSRAHAQRLMATLCTSCPPTKSSTHPKAPQKPDPLRKWAETRHNRCRCGGSSRSPAPASPPRLGLKTPQPNLSTEALSLAAAYNASNTDERHGSSMKNVTNMVQNVQTSLCHPLQQVTNLDVRGREAQLFGASTEAMHHLPPQPYRRDQGELTRLHGIFRPVSHSSSMLFRGFAP